LQVGFFFWNPCGSFDLLGRNEFALRQGFASQNACTRDLRAGFGNLFLSFNGGNEFRLCNSPLCSELTRHPARKRHDESRVLFWNPCGSFDLLGRNEFALRQGFASQNACTRDLRAGFGNLFLSLNGGNEFRLCNSPLCSELTRHPARKRHDESRVLFWNPCGSFDLLGRNEFALRQGFASQNACTRDLRAGFGIPPHHLTAEMNSAYAILRSAPN